MNRGLIPMKVPQLASEPEIIMVPGSGAGVVNITHSRDTEAIIVVVQQLTIPGGVVASTVGVLWKPIDPSTVQLDFDTYPRVEREFRVVII